MPFLFATAIDNACPTLPGGRRIDQMDRSGHYARWEEDFALVRSLGVDALRFGPAYYRTHIAPDRYDWECCDEQMHRLRELEITVIADLCHFGVPSWLGGFQDPAFPVLFAEYARAFARRYPWVRHFTPISEIFACATYSTLRGAWNECETGTVPFVRALRNMCMAHELAVEALLAERPDAIIVQSESLPHLLAGDPWLVDGTHPPDLRHVALDLTLGRDPGAAVSQLLNGNGVCSTDLSYLRERRAPGQRWLVLNVHAGGELLVTAGGERAEGGSRAGLRSLARALHGRYRLPLLHLEQYRSAGVEDQRLRERWESVLALRAAGIPVAGFGWQVLTDVVGWEHGAGARENVAQPVGLATLGREPRAVASGLSGIVRRWRPALERAAELGAAEARDAAGA